jgi:hypothetical protein
VIVVFAIAIAAAPKATLLLPAGRAPAPIVKDGDVIEGAGAKESCLAGRADAPVLVVPAGARVRLRKLGLCPADGQHGAVVRGTLEGEDLFVAGGRTAFRVEDGGVLSLRDAGGRQGDSFVSVIKGSATLERTNAITYATNAYVVGEGTLIGRGIGSIGGEYGLIARPKAIVTLNGASFSGALIAGIGLVGAGGQLEDVIVDGRGKGGEGVLVNDLVSALAFSRLHVRDVRGTAVALIRADAILKDLVIDRVATDQDGSRGSALFAQRSKVQLKNGTITGAKGEAIAVIDGEVTLEDTTIDRAGASGVAAWHGGRVTLVRAEIGRGTGPALLAIEGGAISAQSGAVKQPDGVAATADCASKSSIVLAPVVEVTGSIAGCVRREAP